MGRDIGGPVSGAPVLATLVGCTVLTSLGAAPTSLQSAVVSCELAVAAWSWFWGHLWSVPHNMTATHICSPSALLLHMCEMSL